MIENYEHYQTKLSGYLTNFKCNYPHLSSEPVKKGVLFCKSLLYSINKSDGTIVDFCQRLLSEVRKYTPKLNEGTLSPQTKRYVETVHHCMVLIRKEII